MMKKGESKPNGSKIECTTAKTVRRMLAFFIISIAAPTSIVKKSFFVFHNNPNVEIVLSSVVGPISRHIFKDGLSLGSALVSKTGRIGVVLLVSLTTA